MQHPVRFRLSIAVAAALSVAVALVAPSRASAYQLPPPTDNRVLGPVIEGEAVLRAVRVVARCEGRVLPDRSATCTVRVGYEVEARGPVVVGVRSQGGRRSVGGATIRVNDEVGGTATLAEGERARVSVEATYSLSQRWRLREGPWVMPAMVARHPLLGQHPDLDRGGDGGSVLLARGDRLSFEGEAEVEGRGDGVVRVAFDGQPVEGLVRVRPTGGALSLVLPGREFRPGIVQHGGPVLGLGARTDLATDRGRFLLRGAYEVGIGAYLFGALSVETDFESVLESLVIDVASPELMVLVPSVRVGVGVVARQLGPRPADAALRLRAGFAMFGLGGEVDFDYWPAVQGWTLSVVGRLSP